MSDLFKKMDDFGPLGNYAEVAEGYFVFPELEGEIANRMRFKGQECIVWSVNDYLGLANHPSIRKADTEATRDWGLAYPMGSRLMTGQTSLHTRLENELADFVRKESAFVLNFGYQGFMSVLDTLLGRHDVAVYDSNCHACLVDGLRLHMGKRFVYEHNDMDSLVACLEKAEKLVERTGGGILVVTEGVFGMRGHQGKLREIIALKERHAFRLVVDDAHGFGTMGATGAGTGEEQGVQDGIDVYLATFAKSMAGIGAFVAADAKVIKFLKYNMRSQVFAKSLPMPIVQGSLKRLEMLRTMPELKNTLWTIARALQKGLSDEGFDISNTNTAVTPVMLQGSVDEAMKMVFDLRENYHIFCSIVIYPVIPKGMILLRLIPTASHTLQDVQETIQAFKAVRQKLASGAYAEQTT